MLPPYARFLLIAAACGGAIAVAAQSSLSRAPREVVFVAREMAFYADGSSSPNADVHLRAGERLTLVLVNDDPGVAHDLVIPDWSVRVPLIRGKGRQQIELTVPARRGTTRYSCTPHSRMMQGTIAVE
jgi:plastocyanin